jgi:SAM-dependent methyltransferase
MELEQTLGRRRALLKWFDAPLGRSLQAAEAHRLREVLPRLYGTSAVQLGRIGKMDLLDAAVAPTRVVLDQEGEAGTVSVHGLPEALPFDARSVDLVLLPHTLDFAVDPHQVLREVHRVLSPEGHAVILGFNPISAWGLWRLITRQREAVPWCAHFIRLFRLKDWLSLLEFDLTQGTMLYYRPPIARESVMDRLYFLEKMGDRWWPLGAAVYVVVAQKKVPGLTPIAPPWRKKRRLVGGAPAPIGRMSARHE